MGRRVSQATLAVLAVLLDDQTRGLYGLEIGKAAAVASGSLYPILDRLESVGWLEHEWEAGNPEELGRPRRKHYRLTGLGIREGCRELRSAQERLTPPSWRPLPEAWT